MRITTLILLPIIVVTAIGASFYFFKSRTVGCLTDFELVGVSVYENGLPRNISLNQKQLETEIKVWWSTSNKGWTPSFVSYAPKFLIAVKSGSLNVLTDKIVLSCAGVQLERGIEHSDKEFFEKFNLER